MKFIDSIFAKLKRHPKRIVFPEGTEPRVVHAASAFAHLRLGIPILLGKKEQIEAVAGAETVSLDHVRIVDPETSDDLPAFCQRLRKLKREVELSAEEAREFMMNPNYFGAMMIQHGQADGLVGGTCSIAASVLRPLIQIVRPAPGIRNISSCIILNTHKRRFGHRGLLFCADCAINPEPEVEELAASALKTAQLARQLTGRKPLVAMLSFSTKGSWRHPLADKVVAATALARQRAESEGVEMEIDGELQADTALIPELAERKAPGSLVAGRANVLIFPNLDAGSITSKLLQHLTRADAYGHIVLGLSHQAAEVARGSSVQEILGVAAILGTQAIEYRRLYPVEAEETE